MITFNNDIKIKEAAITEAKLHIEQDRLIKGDYYRNGTEEWRGCSVGCFTKNNNGGHEELSEKWGVDIRLIHLQDRLFESLPEPEHKEWHLHLVEAIPVGVDSSKALPEFYIRMLTRSLSRIDDGQEAWKLAVKSAIEQTIEAHRGNGSLESARSAARSAWSAAESAGSAAESAGSAAWSAAESAGSAAESAGSAARSAAWSAAESAGSAAWSAAESAGSAARSAAWSAAWSAEYIAQRDDILEILKSLKK